MESDNSDDEFENISQANQQKISQKMEKVN